MTIYAYDKQAAIDAAIAAGLEIDRLRTENQALKEANAKLDKAVNIQQMTIDLLKEKLIPVPPSTPTNVIDQMAQAQKETGSWRNAFMTIDECPICGRGLGFSGGVLTCDNCEWSAETHDEMGHRKTRPVPEDVNDAELPDAGRYSK